MKTITLLLVTLLAIASCNELNQEIEQLYNDEFHVQVNCTELQELLTDLKVFGEQYIAKTESERRQIIKVIKESLQNTTASIVLNLGTLVGPIVAKAAEFTQFIQVNQECDQKCAIKCLNPNKRNPFFFDQQCLDECNCKFEIENVESEKIHALLRGIIKDAKKLAYFVQTSLHEHWAELAGVFKHYAKKERNLHTQFKIFFKKHAEQAFDCDMECINDCLHQDYVTFFQVPQCLYENNFCECKQKLFWYGLPEYIESEQNQASNHSHQVVRQLLKIHKLTPY